MRRSKQIVIILNDTLQSVGLQSLLVDYFSPVSITCYQSFNEIEEKKDNIDFYFTDTDTFVLNSDFFMPRKNKSIVLTHAGYIRETQNVLSVNLHINIRQSQEFIIEQLKLLFQAGQPNNPDSTKGLSSREIDVLQLIVKGITNKEIADKLNISLNTVLSHRKNITSKLGIKTVSGLTYYAIMNGLVSANDIEL